MAQIQGEFSGFNEAAVFRLTNGEVWQQARYRYRYHYAYRPLVEIRQRGGGYELFVPAMDESISVVRVSCVCDGYITSDFSGFDGESKFTFDNGQVWMQAEYKYSYHYAYRPEAIVVDGIGGSVLHVEGMNEAVRVRRVR